MQAGMGPRSLIWAGGLAVLVTALADGPRAAGPPAKPGAEQAEKLKERDRLQTQAQQLFQAGKVAEAVALGQKVLALERRLFGDVHPAVAQSLVKLAAYHEARGLLGRHRVRKEVVAIREKLDGAGHCGVVDARWQQTTTELLAGMGPEQRARWSRAKALTQELASPQGKGAAALPLAREAVALHQSRAGRAPPLLRHEFD